MLTSTTQAIPCLICQQPLVVRLAHGRKSKKPFVMLICANDGRHFRAFINDQAYVRQILTRLDSQAQATDGRDDVILDADPSRLSGAVLERGREA